MYLRVNSQRGRDANSLGKLVAITESPQGYLVARREWQQWKNVSRLTLVSGDGNHINITIQQRKPQTNLKMIMERGGNRNNKHCTRDSNHISRYTHV